ncbi:PAS domain-containing protein [Pseudosulfitobacter koreensis]|uniref:PAS domain-containing protein n=1 Tax=Pseudosulfitobacter koreensis TaxID=2968472 RepID=A0ABT1YX36_9RHOB|nr:PAS domain-containing protein [Pseudosulfitobacter koreense]MCR8825446.1 PAS domain-containing protein [Pseudosulfitobacter koreense]
MPLTDILTNAFVACVAATVALAVCTWTSSRQKARPKGRKGGISILFEGENAAHASPSTLIALKSTLEDLTWEKAHDQLRHRFQRLPPKPALLNDGIHHIPAMLDGDAAVLIVDRRGDMTTLQLADELQEVVGQSARLRLLQAKIDTLERSSASAPYPMWQMTQDGHVIWTNAAYDALAESVARDETRPALFDDVLGTGTAPVQRRATVTTQEGGMKHWFDASQRGIDGVIVAHAVNIDAVIEAEAAQRNFVQTLAKTFAQLSIGLAIFDRKGQLALFNPALVDLTRLSAEFLSARPDLLSFFDRLRDSRMMPEPKNYGSWRQDITELIKAAADGRYLETWTLESGQTYRVSGKPNPDRAVAFLIEDISAEVALTRNFRAELEMGQSMIDALPEGLAVFSAAGVLTMCNRVYSAMWGVDPQRSFADITIVDSVQLWHAECGPNTALAKIDAFVKAPGKRDEWGFDLKTAKGAEMRCTLTPLLGGATMLQFRDLRRGLPEQPPPFKTALSKVAASN